MGLRTDALQAHEELENKLQERVASRRSQLVKDAKKLLADRLGGDYRPLVGEVDISRSIVTLEIDGVAFMVGRWDVYLGSLSQRVMTKADVGRYLSEQDIEGNTRPSLLT